MAKLAGQKLRASYVTGIIPGGAVTDKRLLGADLGLPAGTVVKASQIP
jgi:hypothetical protein